MSIRVDTRKKLEDLVRRMNDIQRRSGKLIEAGEAVTPSSPTPSPAAGAGTGDAQTTMATPPEQVGANDATASSDVTVQSVVEQLNAIRSGKSFKDTIVEQELSRYFEGLEQSEQEALHAYLKGIAQIVSGQVDAGQAEEPKNHGVETKSVGKHTRNIKPNVVKRPTAVASSKSTSAIKNPPLEDTSAPSASPIVPKKR